MVSDGGGDVVDRVAALTSLNDPNPDSSRPGESVVFRGMSAGASRKAALLAAVASVVPS